MTTLSLMLLPPFSIAEQPTLTERNLKKTAWAARKRVRVEDGVVGVYSDLDSLVMPPHLLENRGGTILLGDIGSSSERILIFGARRHLHLFHRADSILADGTFQVVTKLWKQQYTLHLNVSGFNLPVIYALLPGKTKNMYLTLLRKVKDMIGDDVHCPWIFDFELSMIKRS